MALVAYGGGVTDLRGSIGGTTFARARGGSYARGRTKPVNPRSPLQETRRAIVSQLTSFWSILLDEPERDSWRAFAAGTTFTNRLGQQIQVPPISAFVMVNALRQLGTLAITKTAPAIPGWSGQPTYTFTSTAGTNKHNIAEPTTPFVKTNPAHHLLFFDYIPAMAGAPGIPRRARYIAKITGAATPPTFPYPLTPAWTIVSGQYRTLGTIFIDENNRVCTRYFRQVTATS